MCTRVIKDLKEEQSKTTPYSNHITYISLHMYTQLRPQAVQYKIEKPKGETGRNHRPNPQISPNCHFIFFLLSLPTIFFLPSLGPTDRWAISNSYVYLSIPLSVAFPHPLSRSALHVSDSITTTQRANTGSILPVLPG
jgi:hypothetical protein